MSFDPSMPTSDNQTARDGTPSPDPGTDVSPAVARFRACRWYQAPEGGQGEYCTHREVKPYAGTSGFDAEAWCPDCEHYKTRRTPRKRDPDEYSY
ncbi:MAG: hypothetical protein FJW23_09510 [Acidimicrobiia bacterium]|nr:hypothetical protein [Acidimicrobiia bacterium]